MSFGYGTYLSPQNRPGESNIPLVYRAPRRKQAGLGGLIYDDKEEIVKESIDHRFSSLSMNQSLPLEDMSNETFLFLGYCFRHYGHFILETLPMLSYCLDERWAEHKKMFLPYFMHPKNLKRGLSRESNINLIKSVIDLLNIDILKIYFHTNYSNIKSRFIVPPKAVHGDRPDIDIDLYKRVIDKIRYKYEPKTPSRITFILRKLSTGRVPSVVMESIHTFATNRNIDIVDMSKLSISQQIELMYDTKTLIGFSGSGMHNSMFLQSCAKSINICDFRDFKSPRCYMPNQKLCNRISGCQEYFIDFQCQEDMSQQTFYLPHNQLIAGQESFTVNNIIQNLNKLI
jgi:hypothetical protein